MVDKFMLPYSDEWIWVYCISHSQISTIKTEIKDHLFNNYRNIIFFTHRTYLPLHPVCLNVRLDPDENTERSIFGLIPHVERN